MASACELCVLADSPAWHKVVTTPDFTVLRVLDSPAFPAFYRVVWHAHVAEWTDLTPAERQRCMEAVAGVEAVMRACLTPRKINLASLGNMVPHLHWHVIGRFDWDSHFPQPIWASAQRPLDDTQLAQLRLALPAVDLRIREQMGAAESVARSL
jgi:diadenosine tetraphosphate (Ap4A) HIT family hydrolase